MNTIKSEQKLIEGTFKYSEDIFKQLEKYVVFHNPNKHDSYKIENDFVASIELDPQNSVLPDHFFKKLDTSMILHTSKLDYFEFKEFFENEKIEYKQIKYNEIKVPYGIGASILANHTYEIARKHSTSLMTDEKDHANLMLKRQDFLTNGLPDLQDEKSPVYDLFTTVSQDDQLIHDVMKMQRVKNLIANNLISFYVNNMSKIPLKTILEFKKDNITEFDNYHHFLDSLSVDVLKKDDEEVDALVADCNVKLKELIEAIASGIPNKELIKIGPPSKLNRIALGDDSK